MLAFGHPTALRFAIVRGNREKDVCGLASCTALAQISGDMIVLQP